LDAGVEPLSLAQEVRVTESSASVSGPSLAWDGEAFAVAWWDRSAGNSEIFFRRFGQDGTAMGAETRVTESASSSMEPSLVWADGAYGVAWQDNRDGNYEIYLARLDQAGQLMGAAARVTNGSSFTDRVDLIWGDGFYLVFQDARDSGIFAARTDQRGMVMGGEANIAGPAGNGFAPAAAWTGSQLGVVWEDLTDGNNEIFFARYDGAKIGNDVRITVADGVSAEPDVAWTGSEFGVVWYDCRGDDCRIYFNRLSAEGVVLQADTPISRSGGGADFPEIVWTGTHYGVAWDEFREGVREVYFREIETDGTPITDVVRLSTGGGSAEYATLVWSGGVFGIAWEDPREAPEQIYFSAIASAR
jgi:hypothetical protein